MLEVTYSMHIVFFFFFFGKGYLIPQRLRRLSTAPRSHEFFRKSNTLTDLLKFEQKGKICESVHFDPSSVSMCITILVLGYSM